MSRLSKFVRSRTKKLRHRLVRLRPYAAGVWRLFFVRTTFIAATGSHGKTTATMLLAGMLRRRGRTFLHPKLNELHDLQRNILRARPWRHRFFVQEVSGHKPGAVARSVALLKPRVGIVTAVGSDHRKAFDGQLQSIADEKAMLVRALPPSGLAVLNLDDPFVAAMRSACRCRVVSFGRAEGVDLRLVHAESVWPERLTLDVEYRGERFQVKTQLIGEQWSISILAALLTALELGVSRRNCLAAIEVIPPAYNRMSVHPTPSGGWYVLDAFKCSFFGIEPCLQFLAHASAPRRTVLFGTISDYPGSSRSHYYRAARMALAVADRVIFTGRNADRVRRLVSGEYVGRLFAIEDPADALRLIESDPLPGELIYVKATKVDRLARFFGGEAAVDYPARPKLT